jgi:hypothetical protein
MVLILPVSTIRVGLHGKKGPGFAAGAHTFRGPIGALNLRSAFPGPPNLGIRRISLWLFVSA